MEIRTLKIILADLEKITEVEIARMASQLEEPEEGQELLATVPAYLQPLWALQHKYFGLCKLSAHAAAYDATTEEEKKSLKGEANRWGTLGEIVKDLVWAESREVLDNPDIWAEQAVEIRKGFTIHRSKPEELGPDFTRIGVPMGSSAMLTMLRETANKLMERLEGGSETPDPKKKPPQ